MHHFLALCLAFGAPALPPEKLTGKDAIDAAWRAGDSVSEAEGEFKQSVQIGADGAVTLRNRGMLVSRQPHAKAVVSLRWKWTEGHRENGPYPDHLAVVLRTGGQQRADWAFEIVDGIVVRLCPSAGGFVTIEEFKPVGVPRQLARAAVALKKGTVYALKVDDEGTLIRVSVDGKELLSFPVQEGQGRVSLYNREPVAGVVKESVVTELRIEGKK